MTDTLPASAPKLEWRGVAKSFGAKRVLDGFQLSVETGRSLVVIGGSGQGKSVALKIAAGLMTPDAGEVRLDGRPLPPGAGHAPRFGLLFQGAALFDSLPTWENVAFRLLHADRLPRLQARERALDAMNRVHLPASAADLRPAELSGGMQKRVGLARAVVASPEILFFDEPTTGLDPITADVINELIVEQVRRLGCTAVSITHDMASARKIADDIAMLHDGRIIWRGSAGEIDRSGDPYVEQFVSGSAHGPIAAAV
jgi:phospholipid/cholesterol/gamma-HCH transport system ATP-binding protein